MKAVVSAAVFAALLAVPGRCHALWDVEPVSKGRAKELGVQVRATPSGTNHVAVEVELPTGTEFKCLDRVDLRLGGNNPRVVVQLTDDRSKPGRVVVRFTADRAHLGGIKLSAMVPGGCGGAIYEFEAKDLVDWKNN
jgi:hypothetical protein